VASRQSGAMGFIVCYVVMHWGTDDYDTSSQLITRPHVASLASSLFWRART
jgi:hypothetical protein